MEKNISLLWLNKETTDKTSKISAATAESLNLAGFCGYVCKNKDHVMIVRDVLLDMPCDNETIKFRQEIFDDILNTPDLAEALEDILVHLETLGYMNKKAGMQDSETIWEFFTRFREIESYIFCVTEITKKLENMDLSSRGLNRLRDTLRQISSSEEFTALSHTVKELSVEANEVKSISLGINLDDLLDPIEVTIVSVNKTKFTDNSWSARIKRILSGSVDPRYGAMERRARELAVGEDNLNLSTKIHSIIPDRHNPIMYHLHKEIEGFIKIVLRDLSAALKKYSHVQGDFLFQIVPDIIFYLNFARLYKDLEENSMCVCMPEIANMEERVCNICDCYNINLALHMMEQKVNVRDEMVVNDIDFDDKGRVLVLTGPNRGGKTVYTVAVGLSQVLFQAGVFVPGSSARLSPADIIASHFPVDENQTVELGRLGEETKRISEIFASATKNSLILLNESLASTSYMEGLYIAKDVLKAFRYLGTRMLYNTHMHDLAGYADEINREVTGDSMVISIVTGIEEGKRSYKVKPGPPLGKSYAMDIAVRYGVSYEQITGSIDQRRNA